MVFIDGPFARSIVVAAAGALLLDDYPNALGAYAFRKLRTAYAGSAARIRRTSDNAEADIGFSGDDFDAAAAATHIGGSTGKIAKWYDQSGNGYDVVQATALSQPLYVASGIGGKPSLEIGFDGSANQQGLATGATTVAINTTDVSACCVMRYDASDSTDNGRGMTIQVDGTSDFNVPSIILMRPVSGINSCYSSGERDGTGALSDNTVYRFMSICDGANHTMHTNGVGSGSPVAFSSTIGGGTNSAIILGATFADNWSEAIVWASDQTANVSGIDSNQTTYYGL